MPEFVPKVVDLHEFVGNASTTGLRAYFGHVRDGNDKIYRTSFYRGQSVQRVLNRWIQQLTSIQDVWPTLYAYEIDLSKKVGPMSVMKPLDQRLPDIRSYYESILLDSTPIHASAIDATLDEWSVVSRLRRKTNLQHVLFDMKLSTNSGLPFFTRRSNVIDETIQANLFYENGYDWQQLPVLGTDSCLKAGAVLGWRGQEGGPTADDVKQRVVWMFPFAVNMYELSVYQPLIAAAQKHKLVPAWIGMDEVDRKITKLFDTKAKDDLVVCTDFSAFDQHFNADMQQCALSVLSRLFADNEQMKWWLDVVFPIKYRIPLLIQENLAMEGPHGMGSGSGGTNADETLAHRCLQHEAAIAHGEHLNPNSQCLGDDGILSYPGCTVEDIVRTYSAHGQEMNLSKQYASTDDCRYLRRWHHTRYRVNDVCVGVYSTCRAIGRLCEQERYYDPKVFGPKMVALRQLSILENVKWHPMKEEFVKFCIEGDDFRLGLDIPGFLANIDQEAMKIIDEMPSFLGYVQGQEFNPAGMNAWWIVQYLRSL